MQQRWLLRWDAMCRKEPVRSDSVRYRTFRRLIGSARKNKLPVSSRFGMRFSDASWLGQVRFASVRFDSVRFSVRFQPIPELNGSVDSVRPARFGFLFLPVDDFAMMSDWSAVEAITSHRRRRKSKPYETWLEFAARVSCCAAAALCYTAPFHTS